MGITEDPKGAVLRVEGGGEGGESSVGCSRAMDLIGKVETLDSISLVTVLGEDRCFLDKDGIFILFI